MLLRRQAFHRPALHREHLGDVQQHLWLEVALLGLVTTKRGELESKDQLKRRIEDAARFVDPDQLCLSPQCGFSSTKEGNDLTQQQQWDKLRLIVETAQEVWGTW